MQGMTNGLVYYPFNEKKETNKPSPNINTITKNSSKPTLTLVHSKLINTSGLDCYNLWETKKPSLNVNVISQNNNDLNSLDFTRSCKESTKSCNLKSLA